MKRFLFLAAMVLGLAGCGSPLPPIPETPAASVNSPADARALLDACLNAHGGAAAYDRLRDVNVRFSSHWATVGPKLQPKLSDTGYREGSEERYLLAPMPGGWIVGQDHQGPKGRKHVLRTPPDGIVVNYNGDPAPSADPEVNAAASLVTDAYSMFPVRAGFLPAARGKNPTSIHRRRCGRPRLRRTPGRVETRLRVIEGGPRRAVHRPADASATTGAVHAQRAGVHARRGGATRPVRAAETGGAYFSRRSSMNTSTARSTSTRTAGSCSVSMSIAATAPPTSRKLSVAKPPPQPRRDRLQRC